MKTKFFVIVFLSILFLSENLFAQTSSVKTKLELVKSQQKEIQKLTFTKQGYCFLFDKNGYWQQAIPIAAYNMLQTLNKSGKQIVDIDFSNQNEFLIFSIKTASFPETCLRQQKKLFWSLKTKM